MRVIFMGTPEFSVPVLDALMRAGHEVVAVYCQPPRRAGRGKKERPTPVQARAEELGLVRILDETRGELTPEAMIQAIRGLPFQPKPSAAFFPGLLDGLGYVSQRAVHLLNLTEARKKT